MKTLDFLKWTMVCALGVFVTASCSDDDDDDRVDVPSQVQAAFDQKYAGAWSGTWSMEAISWPSSGRVARIMTHGLRLQESG